MTETKEPTIYRLVKSTFGCGDRRAVLRDNPEATVTRLTRAAVQFNHRAIQDFGGREEETRGVGLVEQVIGSAFQSFGGVEHYSDDFSKAAKVLQGITGGHPFNDGNKRTGFLTAAYLLEQTGHSLPDNLSIERAEKLCMEISSGRLRDEKVIAKELRKIWSGR